MQTPPETKSFRMAFLPWHLATNPRVALNSSSTHFMQKINMNAVHPVHKRHIVATVIWRLAAGYAWTSCVTKGDYVMSKVRLSIEVSGDLANLLEELADSEQTTKTEIVRRGLSVMKAFRNQIRAGRPHLGFAADASRLDAEIIGVLSDSAERKRDGDGENRI